MRRLTISFTLTAALSAGSLEWRPWSDSVFAQARQQKRFVLLDLEAVWCHWCHVMDETTYADPAIVALLRANYILVRVDQDARPDLSNRYEDYGWPATIVFDSGGREIVKRRGYIAPREMASMLRAIVADPTPGPSVKEERPIEPAASPFLSPTLRKQLHESYRSHYDEKHGSWGFDQKFLDWDGVEYAMALARNGDKTAEHMAMQTLDAQLQLLDPVWGGVYQYSTGGDWKEPHFEKIMQMQAENMRIYALAYEQWRKPEYRKAAEEIHRFLKTFLMSPEGAFYTSQDADVIPGRHSARYFQLSDAARKRQGVPQVDRHIYARENGWAINALVSLYQATDDAEYLSEAKRAAVWVIRNRALAGGGFRHDAVDQGGPFVGDSVSMARAFLSLYVATADREWLQRSEEALRFVSGKGKQATRDENVMFARVSNLIFQYTGDAQFRKSAEQALRYIIAPNVLSRKSAAPALLADLEMTSTPVHITIVGHKDDPAALRLFQIAMQYPSAYKRLEWWDKREGKLPNPDVDYPELKHAAAFVCTGRSCSAPIVNPEKLVAAVR